MTAIPQPIETQLLVDTNETAELMHYSKFWVRALLACSGRAPMLPAEIQNRAQVPSTGADVHNAGHQRARGRRICETDDLFDAVSSQVLITRYIHPQAPPPELVVPTDSFALHSSTAP